MLGSAIKVVGGGRAVMLQGTFSEDRNMITAQQEHTAARNLIGEVRKGLLNAPETSKIEALARIGSLVGKLSAVRCQAAAPVPTTISQAEQRQD